MRKDSDTVFFLTLIDFLLQVCFFGIVIYAVSQVTNNAVEEVAKSNSDRLEASKKIEKAFGVSNITELTDELTRLAPLDNLRGTADFIQRAGGAANASGLMTLVEEQGGIDKVKAKIIEGIGKPGCAKGPSGELLAIATLVATNEQISVVELTPELKIVLEKNELDFNSVKSLSISNFPKVWAKLIKTDPQCRHPVVVRERTELSAPLKAVGSIFYYRIR